MNQRNKYRHFNKYWFGMEEIKYAIILRLSKQSRNGVLLALNLWLLYESGNYTYQNGERINAEDFRFCFTMLIKDKILIEPKENLYRLNDDFFWEPDPIGRYKYIKDILHNW